MILATYRRRKPPRYQYPDGRRHRVIKHIMQDGADFYVESPLEGAMTPAKRVYTASMKVKDDDTWAAGMARGEFKKFARKMGWEVKFARSEAK